MGMSAEDRKLYKKMYGFACDEQSRGPTSGEGNCACQKTKATGRQCLVSPSQYVGPLLVCQFHIKWAKKALQELRTYADV